MMGPRARRACTTTAALATAGMLFAGVASARGPSFTEPLKLRNSPPKGDLQGGEPSVAFDPGGRWVYVVAPGGGENGGVGFWRSHDGGRRFTRGRSLGSLVGGGDSDVDVGPDHTVYIADLEVVANALCRSHDHGKTFDSNCDTGIAGNQTGVESDREWVTPSPTDPNLVYFSYHAITTETPLVYRSDSGGDPGTFNPCGPVLAPGSEAEQNYAPTTFKDVVVFQSPRANLANIFPYVVARGKTLYAAATGIKNVRHAKHSPPHFGVYLFRSRSGGRHWSRPIRVDPNKFKANALASLTIGKRPNQVALGFYRSKSSSDPTKRRNRWKFEVARSTSFGRHFAYTRITPKPIHYGKICTTGILCTGGRNLLDFSSIATNPRTGCLMAVFAGDPYDNPTNHRDDEAAPYVSRQTAGCFPG